MASASSARDPTVCGALSGSAHRIGASHDCARQPPDLFGPETFHPLASAPSPVSELNKRGSPGRAPATDGDRRVGFRNAKPNPRALSAVATVAVPGPKGSAPLSASGGSMTDRSLYVAAEPLAVIITATLRRAMEAAEERSSNESASSLEDAADATHKGVLSPSYVAAEEDGLFGLQLGVGRETPSALRINSATMADLRVRNGESSASLPYVEAPPPRFMEEGAYGGEEAAASEELADLVDPHGEDDEAILNDPDFTYDCDTEDPLSDSKLSDRSLDAYCTCDGEGSPRAAAMFDAGASASSAESVHSATAAAGAGESPTCTRCRPVFVHEAVANTKEPVAVLEDFLYLGDRPGAFDESWLRSAGITHVVNCAGAKGEPADEAEAGLHTSLFGEGYGNVLVIPAEDDDEYDILDWHWEEVRDFLKPKWEQYCSMTGRGREHEEKASAEPSEAKPGSAVDARPPRVFVHCIAGINRSATMCVAFAAFATGCDVVTAVADVADRRPHILTNANFVQQLAMWAIDNKMAPPSRVDGASS